MHAPQLFEWSRDRLGRWAQELHDALGRVAVRTDALGRKTTYTRDLQYRMETKKYADDNALSFTYENTTSRLKKRTDAGGRVRNFQYFADDRLQQVSYTNAAGQALTPPTATVSLTYEANYPRLSTMSDGTGTTSYGYHPINTGDGILGDGRLASVDGPLANDTVTHTYDELGREVSSAVDGVAETAAFDALGRVTTEANPLGSFGYSYVNTTGRVSGVTYPNGQTSTLTYHPNTAPAGTGNGDQRLQSIWHQLAGGATLSKHDYGYNPAGEITSWQQQLEANPASTEDFGYDLASQLLRATRKDTASGTVQKQWTWAYDLAGNRTIEQVDAALASATHNNLNQLTARNGAGPMTFEGTLNEPATVTVGGNPATVDGSNKFRGTATVSPGQASVTITATDASGNVTTKQAEVNVTAGAASQSLTYDLDGSMTGDGVRTLAYDAEHRLVKVTVGANVKEFVFNGAGQRVAEKMNGTVTKQWVWDGYEMREERDASNAVTKRFYGQGMATGATVPVPAANQFYYTRDHLGSIREMTDSTGAIRARYIYDAWGRQSKLSGDLEADFGYTGHYFDAPSGLTDRRRWRAHPAAALQRPSLAA